MSKAQVPELVQRVEHEIQNYKYKEVEIAEDVFFSQHKTIKRIYKFKNRELGAGKINEDLSYNYWTDIISPRVDSEVKNLRFDSKNVMAFSRNPFRDYAAVFIANASLRSWMADNGEDEKLKEAVEEYSANGNVGFKRVKGTYELMDALNTVVTNQKAKSVNETNLIERHEMTASEVLGMDEWDKDVAKKVVKKLGDHSYTSVDDATPTDSSSKFYEIWEYTGEVNEKEYNQIKNKKEGDENKYFLAKVIFAGLRDNQDGERYVLFADKLDGEMEDHYIYAHRGKYEGRFWRQGIVEMLFDHQLRANEIVNDLARGLSWASKTIFKSTDSSILQNIRADLENGDVIIAKDIEQLLVRMQGADQLIADWNRLMNEADRLTNSMEVVRGENAPSGTPFRQTLLLDQNAGKMFVFLRQKLTLPYKRVFREWVLPTLLKDLQGEDMFNFVGEIEVLDQLREIVARSWYMKNLVQIGPHTREQRDAIIQEKIDEMRNTDPVVENSKEIWKAVKPRIFITITGENSDLADNVQDIISLLQLEQDPERIAFLLDSLYKIRNIPVPPKPEQPEPQEAVVEPQNVQAPTEQIAGEAQPAVV